MAYIDSRTGELVLRVVYDGAPSAGKTTNVRRLHDGLLATRPGALESPGTEGRQTEWFDWRDFFGGYLEGFPLRCEVLTVPGQAQRSRRRAAILTEADCVVLVLDGARPGSHRASLDAPVDPRTSTPSSGTSSASRCHRATRAGASSGARGTPRSLGT
ncbi:MAG: hypothetical protein KF901_27030 [Myxococcales bacterium]|nr:hypothetical protein [Myxococcales bacterium]